MKFLFALCLGLTAAFAQASELDFVLVNQSGRDLQAVYLSSAADKDWNGNILTEGAVLKDGGTLKVRFPATPEAAKWDINIVDRAGLSVTLDDVNLIDVKKITLRKEAGKISAIVE